MKLYKKEKLIETKLFISYKFTISKIHKNFTICVTRLHTSERQPPRCAYFASPASSCKRCDMRVCHACAVHHTSLRIEL